MNIVFVTIDDKFFLPGLFDRLIPNIPADDEVRAIFVKPLYKNDSSFKMAVKYLKTFGIKEFFCFSFGVVTKSILSKSSFKKHRKTSQVFSDSHKEYIHFDGDVNGKECLDILKSWDVDLLISVGCPQLFTKELIITPKHGCLNLHGALLPNYRGVLPSFWMLKNGEKFAGNTLFFVNEQIDGGDILIQESFPIEDKDSLYSLIARSKLKASDVLLKGISTVRNGSYSITEMNMNQGSYFGWPSRKDVVAFLRAGRRIR